MTAYLCTRNRVYLFKKQDTQTYSCNGMQNQFSSQYTGGSYDSVH